MPVAKSYTRAQWDVLVHSLESLPVKPESEQRVSITDAMKEMRVLIGAVREKGYTLEEIVEHARDKGVEFSVGSVKYALYPSRKNRVPRQAVKETTRGHAAPYRHSKKDKSGRCTACRKCSRESKAGWGEGWQQAWNHGDAGCVLI